MIPYVDYIRARIEGACPRCKGQSELGIFGPIFEDKAYLMCCICGLNVQVAAIEAMGMIQKWTGRMTLNADPMSTKEFIRFLRKAAKEWPFTRIAAGKIKVDGRRTARHIIAHISPSMEIYTPFQVVYHHYFRKLAGPELTSSLAAAIIGLPRKRFLKLWAATTEEKGHSAALRRRILRSCNMDEIPHSDRPRIAR